MNKQLISSAYVALFALSAFGSSRARAQDAIVPDDFATIGNALTGATDVDADGRVEIFVRAGTYAENVHITSSNVLLEGEPGNPPTIQGNGGIHVLWVEAFTGTISNVTVRNFVVTGGVAFDGVELRRMNGGAIQNVESSGSTDGFRLNGVAGVTLTGCYAHDNAHTGFRLSGLVASTITANVARKNGHDGIDLSGGLNAVFDGNESHHNGDRGLRARRVLDTAIRNNLFHDNVSDGARFEAITRVTFTDNVCGTNGENGLRTRATHDGLVSHNTFSNNGAFGVRMLDDVNLDFNAAIAGVQDPLGDNTFSGNASGNVRND